MSAVPPEAFSDRSNMPWHIGNSWDLPVLAPGVSTHAQGLRLRRVGTRLAFCVADRVAFPVTEPGRHAKMLISELDGWPACTPCPCHTRDITIASVGVGAERLARPFSYDSFIRNSRPVLSRRFLCHPSFCLTVSACLGGSRIMVGRIMFCRNAHEITSRFGCCYLDAN